MTIQDDIMFALTIHGPLPRNTGKAFYETNLTDLLKQPRTTIYDALKKLLEKGKIVRTERVNGQGRPPVYWELKENGLEVFEK